MPGGGLRRRRSGSSSHDGRGRGAGRGGGSGWRPGAWGGGGSGWGRGAGSGGGRRGGREAVEEQGPLREHVFHRRGREVHVVVDAAPVVVHLPMLLLPLPQHVELCVSRLPQRQVVTCAVAAVNDNVGTITQSPVLLLPRAQHIETHTCTALLSSSESVLLCCSNSPSWPSRSRCLVSVVTHAPRQVDGCTSPTVNKTGGGGIACSLAEEGRTRRQDRSSGSDASQSAALTPTPTVSLTSGSVLRIGRRRAACCCAAYCRADCRRAACCCAAYCRADCRRACLLYTSPSPRD